MAGTLSRSEVKRRIREVENLVRELAALAPGEIADLPMDEEWRRLLAEVSSLKGGARKRQIKYLTKVIRDRDNTELYRVLSGKRGDRLEKKRAFHRLEFFRDTLVDEAIAMRKQLQDQGDDLAENWSSETVETIVAELPAVDQVALRRLAAIFARTRNKKHTREIFRLLQAAQDKKNRGSGSA